MISKALTIAGSDNSGGAGIQADLKTMTCLNVYGMSVITSITVQNTTGIFQRYDLPEDIVYNQIKAIAEDINIDSAKIGMLGNGKIIQSVEKAIKDFDIKNLVIDTVLTSKSGYHLLEPSDEKIFIDKLIPLATLLTPNIPEAEILANMKIKNIEDMEKACKVIYTFGCNSVLLKGGHMENDELVDIFYDGFKFEYFPSKRVNTKNTHGTGCTLSAAITSYLAKGYSLLDSIKEAKKYIQGAIENSLDFGKGHGPLNHMWIFHKG